MSLVTRFERWLMRGGTAANLAAVDEVPLERELQIETDTLKLKLGDGVTAWSLLPYIGTDSIPEQSNLYYTDSRVYAAVKGQLVAGPNVTLTPDDETETIQVDASGSGGGGSDATTSLYQCWDFLCGRPITSNNVGSNFVETNEGPVAYIVGSGSAAGLIASEPGHPGILQMNTGTTTTGRVRMFFTPGKSIALGGGLVRYSAGIRIPVLSDATNRFEVAILLVNVIDGARTPIIASYTDNVNGGNWTFSSGDGVGTSTDNTAVGPVANTFTTVEIEVAADATSAKLYVDGTEVGEVVGNIPTGSLGLSVHLNKASGTTARACDVDFGEISQSFTTPR